MNRVFSWLNLLGVVALGILCVFQWRLNRQLNLHSFQLEKKVHEQTTRIAAQQKTIEGQTKDLDDFREQISNVSALLKTNEFRLAAAEEETRRLAGEREQLKHAITNWAAAVTARDEQLKETNLQLQELAKGRNEAVAKFNELADKYNSLVKEVNEARSRPSAAPSEK